MLAPLAGEVVERLCSPGQLLQAGGTQCFTLSDMTSIWVLVNIYQNDVARRARRRPGHDQQRVLPGRRAGQDSIHRAGARPDDADAAGAHPGRQPGERLKKDMYVTAEVHAGVIPDALLVPDAAVLRDANNMPYVYLQTGANQFAHRMVTLGDSQGGRTQVVTGLTTGDRIVGDGSLFLQFQNSLQR